MTIRQPGALLLGLSLILAACGGEGLTLPPDGAAANIEVMSGNGQSGRVGSTLAESLVVKVTDTQDRPVAGANVLFDFTADGSAASPATASTDGDGRAASRLVLGTRVGPVTGTVSVPVDAGVTPVQAAITATAVSDNADGIALVSGNDQTGAVGTELSAALVVAVTDAFGNPIAGVTVEWTVTGGGSVSNATTVTGANGQASVTRTLGSGAGAQTAVATAAGLAGSPVTFTHTATAGTATGVVKVSGDNQSGSPGAELALPLVVQVLDGAGNPIPNRALTWTIGEGGGSVAPVNTTTDAQGNASTRWTLGPGVGPNTVNAVVSGLAPATFSATATAGEPSASNSSVSASPATINVGTGSSTITVTVRDAGNNPVSGVSVTPEASGSGNTFNPISESTGTNGVATFTFSSTVAESKTIMATAGGVTITDQATVNVQKVGSTVEITNDDPDPSTAGTNVTVEFTVEGSGGTPTGDVVVTINGGLPTETCTGTLSGGSGSCVLPVTQPGTGADNRRIITATYGGDARFSGDTDTENHRVNPAAPASTTTTITSDNQDPSAAGVEITVTFTVTSSAGTPTGNVQVTDPQGGSCSASVAAGSCQYTPGGAGTRTITATYEGSSAFTGSSGTAEHVVTNMAPLANDDLYLTTVDAGFHAPGGDRPSLLNNDEDLDGDPLSTTSVTAAGTTGGGSVTIGTDGSFDYTPLLGFTGIDSFTYTVNDGRGGSATGTASIVIS